jgi:UDP:flavonoid glycosyltransferase YjiC (YdhE family)
MKRLAFLLFGVLAIVVPTHALHAQAEAEQEELHYITVTTFKVPLGEAMLRYPPYEEFMRPTG